MKKANLFKNSSFLILLLAVKLGVGCAPKEAEFDGPDLQQEIWEASLSGNKKLEEELKHKLSYTFLHESHHEVSDSKLPNGANKKKLLEFHGSIRAIYKETEGRRSIATYVLDQLLGVDLVPMTVPFENGFLMAMLKGMKPGFKKRTSNFNTWQIFSYLAGRTDLHKFNALYWEKHNRVIAIDNDEAFSEEEKIGIFDSTGNFFLKMKPLAFVAGEDDFEATAWIKVSKKRVDSTAKAKILHLTPQHLTVALEHYLSKSELDKTIKRLKNLQNWLNGLPVQTH